MGKINWVEWLASLERKHIYSFRDDVVDIAEKIIKDIWFAHGIKYAHFQYTSTTLHIELGFPDGHYYGMIAFDDIDPECELLSDYSLTEKSASVEKRLKYLLLDSFGRR